MTEANSSIMTTAQIISKQQPSSQIRSILRELNNDANGDITASAAISTDGLMLASQLQTDVDANRFAAMSASLLALADQTTAEIHLGEMRQVMVMGTTGVVLLTHAGSQAVLAVSARSKASLGKVLLDAKRAAQKIEQLLQA